MPPKKPFEFLRRPATREVEGPTVVPNPIPQEELRRRVPPAAMQPDPEVDAERVPGERAVLEEVTVQGETTEMIEGAPKRIIIPSFPHKPVTPSSWPIHLTAQTLLPPTQNAAPNVQALRAPADKWLRIDEIKFEVSLLPSDNTGVTLPVQVPVGLGCVVGVNLSLGGKPITSGFVPVSMLGMSRRLSAERMTFREGASWAVAEEYSWTLPVPIYVPPCAVLAPVFEHRGFLDFNTRARVSYAGVVLNTPPSLAERSKLPFASSWVSPALTLDGAHNLAESTEKDLVGPTNSDFHVDYLIGRVYVAVQMVSGANTWRMLLENDTDTTWATAFWGTVVADQVEVALRSSWGTAMVPDYALFPAVFDRVNRQLNVPHVMPCDGYCIVRVRSNGTLADAAALSLVTLVGWQEVSP